jgi:hypothetical protein
LLHDKSSESVDCEISTITELRAASADGRVWGEGHAEAFTNGCGDASHVREALAPLMPKPGEDRSSVSDVIGSVYDQCIELMAGRAAEWMLLSDSEPVTPVDDLRQARELAMLICSSEEAIETFVAHCDVAARDCCCLTAMS